MSIYNPTPRSDKRHDGRSFALDTPTHGLIGGLVNLATVCSVLPDADTFLPGDGLDYLQTHRGVSHSLLGVVAAAVLVTWIARRLGLRHVSFAAAYVVSLCGFLTHIAFDLATTYGTSLFLPFFDIRASLDLLFIIDPYLDLIVISGPVLGWRLGPHGYRWGAAALAAYLLMAAAVNGQAHRQMRDWAVEKGHTIDHLAVMPVPFSPLHRRGILHSGHAVHLVHLSVAGGAPRARYFGSG